ncbi:prepilin peptidase [Natronoglycomyces albus]|uniref:Prepilin peptidase n=1 Tax=Natronoglycomyces albus TaxID=2811108 RepID=A0A895XVP9_9ACTN|nr:A24 family peptidase [Natronoglycomyces albus]QSB06606.1 prepilin peptidase [Natronoglycomyces albus]
MATNRAPNAYALTALTCTAVLITVAQAINLWHAMALFLVIAVGVAAGWIDAYEHRLPDVLIVPTYPLVGALLLAGASPPVIVRAAVCAAAAWAIFSLAVLAGHMGFGDVKLAGLLAMVLGWGSWESAVVAFVAASVAGGLYAVTLFLRGRGAQRFAFGPALLLGGLTALVVVLVPAGENIGGLAGRKTEPSSSNIRPLHDAATTRVNRRGHSIADIVERGTGNDL